jgi:predicted GNAT family acetyltransferase
MTTEIVRLPDRQRFELLVDGVPAGHLSWFMKGGVTVLDHTIVKPDFGGQGLGSVLARGVLDVMRTRGKPYAVDCPFLREWVAKNPEYSDVPLWT